MPAYNVFPIELPVSPAQLAACKKLRLTSLQIDPQAFSSTYAREVAFPEDVWRQRLESSAKRTFIASVSDVHKGADVGEGEWIGNATILGPSEFTTPSFLKSFQEAGVGANWEMYGLFAMWVHPAHRGKGVGAKLVNACLEWARTNVDAKFSSESETSREFEKVVVLLVYNSNVAGRALYFRTGFTDLEGLTVNEGERWMSVKVQNPRAP